MIDQNKGSLEEQFFKFFDDNEETLEAYYILKYTNHPVFLTGKAGTGKSTFIKLIQHISQSLCLITAPTGIAARNIDGITIHSRFHIPFGFQIPDDQLIESIRFNEIDRTEIEASDLLIIDEISMLSSSTLDIVNLVLQKVCNNSFPFGGKKVLMVGDPFQLPPITNSSDFDVLQNHYDSEYFFDADIFKAVNPIRIELKRVYRQNDEKFLNILNGIRSRLKVFEHLQILNRTCKNSITSRTTKQNSIILTFTNRLADEINNDELNKLTGDSFNYKATVWGHFNWQGILAEKELELKIGARVMFTKNHPKSEYVNGSMGIVAELSKDEIIVQLDDGEKISVEKEIWTNNQYEKSIKSGDRRLSIKEKGGMSQYPLKLAWAITVHKSQGLTFDDVYLLNEGSAFAIGQLYVALSRCRSIQGLKIYKPLQVTDVKTDCRILKFYYSIHEENRKDILLHKIADQLEALDRIA
ncbi:MAG TPA: AAA family ATPase [Flavisolibacter sp.]|jgi:ATP-dependent exoDNAse (exonuclease V) alpha subunit|nr:AAA family ATPase [Flavisolibacter sp.]